MLEINMRFVNIRCFSVFYKNSLPLWYFQSQSLPLECSQIPGITLHIFKLLQDGYFGLAAEACEFGEARVHC